jgi:cell division protein FtsA
MKINSPSLFIEINNSEYVFVVGDKDEQDNFKVVYKCTEQIQGINNSQITDFDQVFNDIKKNIYLLEEKINFTFKDTVLIINNFNCSFINLSGFKKLNGSQILKENITFILNSLKSNIDITEDKKTIIHIFNSKYYLDKKKVENLPIGLFGDFYSHELSFCLINDNDYKNLNNIFNKCNLKIKKIYFKNFVEGAYLSNTHTELDSFFLIEINENKSQISFFENGALKFEQNFNFGLELIIKDISKVTSIKINTVKKIINNIKFSKDISEEELIESMVFKDENYVKIKKQLIFQIAESRIQEILNIIIAKNINFINYIKNEKTVLLKIANQSHLKCFEYSYLSFLEKNNNFKARFIENTSVENLMNNVNKLTLYGWKKEAIPITQSRKSIIAKFFDTLFS